MMVVLELKLEPPGPTASRHRTIGKSLGGIPWVVLKALPRDAESEIGKSSGWDEKYDVRFVPV